MNRCPLCGEEYLVRLEHVPTCKGRSEVDTSGPEYWSCPCGRNGVTAYVTSPLARVDVCPDCRSQTLVVRTLADLVPNRLERNAVEDGADELILCCACHLVAVASQGVRCDPCGQCEPGEAFVPFDLFDK